MKKPIQIFKPGKHTAMSGAALEFTEADLKATAAAYDPDKHEAPIVIGHPKHDDPAWGWVKSLSFADGLDAETHQVDAGFAEMVDDGKFKKVSASFYSPDSPSNPVPGVYYLRHVGFLGAQPPAVKGLRAPEFGDAEVGVVEFAEWDDVDNASLWRSLRDWIIGKFGKDEADQVIPSYTVQSLEQSAQDELRESRADDSAAVVPAPVFSEPTHKLKGDVMSAEEKARLAELEAKNKEQEKQLADFAEAERKRVSGERHAANVAFAEGLAKAGKLLPKHKDVAVATLDFMSAQEQAVEFGEGDAKKPLVDAFKEFMNAMPKQIEFSEVGGDKDDKNAAAQEFPVPRGYEVDPERMQLHLQALSYAEKHSVDYVTAVQAVSQKSA